MADDDKKAERQALVPDAEGNAVVDVHMGPYRGNRLKMTAADAQAAINGHWARDPNEEYGHHDPLDDQQRTDALAAAHAWAQKTWDEAQGVVPPEPPPPDGGDGGATRKRAMKPDEGHSYTAREHKT